MSATTTTADDPGATIADDWEGIRYVFYVTLGWLTVTALAVVFLMLVVPSLL